MSPSRVCIGKYSEHWLIEISLYSVKQWFSFETGGENICASLNNSVSDLFLLNKLKHLLLESRLFLLGFGQLPLIEMKDNINKGKIQILIATLGEN